MDFTESEEKTETIRMPPLPNDKTRKGGPWFTFDDIPI